MNAGYELYALIGNVLFPGVNFLLSFRQKTKIELDGWDYGALGLGVISIMLWGVVRQDVYLSQYANYLAISADLCAVIPTARLVKRSPMIEKPLPWILFAGAFMIDIFAIKSSNPANYILPVYMVLASGLIAYLQIAYRVKNSIQEKWY